MLSLIVYYCVYFGISHPKVTSGIIVGAAVAKTSLVDSLYFQTNMLSGKVLHDLLSANGVGFL